MEAAFDREAQSGEFFIEFQTYIQDTKLVERFVELGAGEVCSITFGKDQGISAMDALRRVQNSQNKTGIKVTRGSCSKQMQDRLEEKEQTVKDVDKEFDEKTTAAIQFSLKTIGEDMHSQVVKLDGIQSQVVKLEKIENDVQLQAADVVDIKNGVCGVIPDYQKKITNLEEALAHKTKLCDRIEGQKGRLTMEINKLKWEVGELNDKATSLQLQNFQQNKKIQELQEQLDICKSIALLKQTHEELQRTAEILASTLEEERAAKRARA
jgi:chromosome segregation ATPase